MCCGLLPALLLCGPLPGIAHITASPRMLPNQYLTTAVPSKPSKVHGGAYASPYIGHAALEVHQLEARVQHLKTVNQSLRSALRQKQEELQHTQSELAEACAHVKALYRKIAAA